MGLEKVEALQNLVVLDLTRVVAGPYAGSILGDFGAECNLTEYMTKRTF